MGSLSEEQMTIITGTLLGDGSLRRKKNTLLEINHSYKQKTYVFWLYDRLKNIVKTPPKLKINGLNRLSYRFTTQSLSDLNAFYAKFYTASGEKIVPDDLNLNGLSLAVWLMDDGSKSRNSIYLNTQQFSVKDQKKLISFLYPFGIKATLNKDKKYYRLRISCDTVPTFKKLVTEYILQDMRYKLPL